MELYPLKFTPLFKYRIWGGSKLKTALNKEYTEENIGESWEISDVSGDETRVVNGFLKGKTLKELTKQFKGDFVGKNVYKNFGEDFPLLIKFIDAETPLSIQVHPSNEIAKERHNSFGKNEMWYVMQADENAELIVGFDEAINKDSYKTHLENNTILDVMHHEYVSEGDTFYIPTGRVHAIGAGVLLAEIQQTSDITYRIYDYDRVDAKTGEKRELHNELAIDVIDFKVQDSYKTTYELMPNISNTLVHSPYFKTNIMSIEGEVKKDYTAIDSFVIYICVEGVLNIIHKGETYLLSQGETIMFPSSISTLVLNASESAKILEVYF
jgi:mannose-6-phosphate isomerase